MILSVSMLMATMMATEVEACTNFIVGKKASVDGSVICSYSADSFGSYMPLYHYAAGKHAKGTKRKVYEWDTNKYLGEIDEAEETYNVVGNTNEWQVTIGETTYGGREEMVDSTGIIDYGSLIYIALQRSRSAREAIRVMTSLVEQYGYCSEGETFTICDADEAWIMEMQGCGPDRKVSKERTVWVALRIPDDAICAHANQSRIGRFNMKDNKNVLYSKNVVKYARKMGWYTGKDEDFAWKWTYAAPDFSGRRICDARAWSFFNHHKKGMERYLPWVLGKDKDAEDMPLWLVPDKKLSVADVINDMRDHYEGTPLAIDSTDIGGGIWQMPYRPTPLYYKVDGKTYFNERPISTQQASFVFVSQMRSWLPREVGGCFWFGNDDGNMVAFVPIYCSMTQRPECKGLLTYRTQDLRIFASSSILCQIVQNKLPSTSTHFFTFLRLCCQLADCFYEAFQIASFGEHAQLILRQDHLQLAFIEVCQHRSSARKDAPSLRRHCATAKTFLAAHQTHIAQTINILHPFYWLQWQQSQILQSFSFNASTNIALQSTRAEHYKLHVLVVAKSCSCIHHDVDVLSITKVSCIYHMEFLAIQSKLLKQRILFLCNRHNGIRIHPVIHHNHLVCRNTFFLDQGTFDVF